METDSYNKALIYDADCPMCKAYTKAFVKTGMLQQKNRIAFTSANMRQFKIDWQKAKHEIPLIDLQTGEVKYGVDALADILQQKFSFIKALLKIKWLNFFWRSLYKFISYNRKVIVAKYTLASCDNSYSPDFNFTARWLLIFFCLGISNLFLSSIFQSTQKIFFLTSLFTVVIFFAQTIVSKNYSKMISNVVCQLYIVILIACFFLFLVCWLKNILHFNTTTFYAFIVLAFMYLLSVLYKRVCYLLKNILS